MPSGPARKEEMEELKKRHRGVKYGGEGDKQHLGGFIKFDKDGVSPRAWRYMMQNLTVKSVVDVGCGRGISTLWFKSHGARVLCLEGSHDAVTHSHLPAENIVEHDFSRGPYWPQETFDVLWSVEFLEHVGRPYMKNYLPAFHKAALIFASHSIWGGWHHVEVPSAQTRHTTVMTLTLTLTLTAFLMVTGGRFTRKSGGITVSLPKASFTRHI